MSLERNPDGSLTLYGTRIGAEIERYVEAERIKELLAGALAANTNKAHRSDWDAFCAWALDRGVAPLPAEPATIASYIRWMIDRPPAEFRETYVRPNGTRVERVRRHGPAKLSTVRRHLASISVAHRAVGHPSPTRDIVVQLLLRGIKRERGVRVERKTDLDGRKLAAVLAATHPRATPRDLRDRAILLLGWSGALRRSEIAAIDIEHLVRDRNGLEIVIERSKTNQEGEDESVLISGAKNPAICPIRALDAWLEAAGITSGPVFRRLDRHGNLLGRIQPAVVATVVKAFANRAGLDPRLFAGHSLRSGWITTAANHDRLERDIMRHSRHKSVEVARRYIRRGTKWKDHAGAGLLDTLSVDH